MQKLVDVSAWPIKDVLNVLLEDKTTRKNVVWGTDAYADKGSGYDAASGIRANALLGESPVVLQPRIEKDLEEQRDRTRKRAEVYTPSWLCNKMNNYCDREWFKRSGVFNSENDDHTWTASTNPIYFVEKKGRKTKSWQIYVDSRRLEITCGEAPFLVSRYDAATGELLPLKKRIGILDRKLRVVDENTKTESEWLKWAQRAVESCYGYEYQGDSLLIARINVLMTFYDYYEERWGKSPTKSLIKKIANIVAWNIWQMDGINDDVPLSRIEPKRPPTLELFRFYGIVDEGEEPTERFLDKPSKIKNWRSREKAFEFKKLKEAGLMKKKMFDFVIGNPPYQEEFSSEGNKTYAAPVYNLFMDAAYQIANSAELIHPARFLFNAGSTPKDWNRKMLNDPHFKVLSYEEDGVKVFPNTFINGGVAITYYDCLKDFGSISVFTKYPQLNLILHKVLPYVKTSSLADFCISAYSYHFTEQLHIDFPKLKETQIVVDGKNVPLLSKGHEYDLKTNVISKLTMVFFDQKPDDSQEYIQVLGRTKSGRISKFIRRNYVNKVVNLDCYKVVLSSADGAAGQLGHPIPARIIGTPSVLPPETGTTESFVSIGLFKSNTEAQNALRYIKTRFVRTLVGVLKVTQHITPEKWVYVPLEDFTSNSVIDWTQSIAEIDQQLYKKYGLTQDEIEFIETHVKEMK